MKISPDRPGYTHPTPTHRSLPGRPPSRAHSRSDTVQPSSDAVSVHHLRRHVLVIENSEVVRRLIEVCLRPLNLDITSVATRQDGWERAVVRPPDVVVLDPGLPGDENWSMMADLRTTLPGHDFPILMLTEHGEAIGEDDAVAMGASRLVSKPFLPAVLRDAMADLLEAV